MNANKKKAKKAADDDATGSGTKNDKVPGTNFPDLKDEDVESGLGSLLKIVLTI